MDRDEAHSRLCRLMCGKALRYRQGVNVSFFCGEADPRRQSFFIGRRCESQKLSAQRAAESLVHTLITIFFRNNSHIRNSQSRINESAKASEAGFGGSHDA